MTTSINLSHFIFEKVMFVVCEKWVETRTDCYIDPSSSLDHSSTSFASWLGLLNRGSLGAQSPLPAAGSHFGILSPTLEPPGYLVILLSNVHLLPLFFRLFTQVHLLIDDSVEGQYITLRIWGFWKRVSWGLRLGHGGRQLSSCHWGESWGFGHRF